MREYRRPGRHYSARSRRDRGSERDDNSARFSGIYGPAHRPLAIGGNAASQPPKPFYTPAEFYTALGGTIGRSAIYELVRANRIRHVRLGRKILIPATELTEFPHREMGRTN